jgi:hypothetical protein
MRHSQRGFERFAAAIRRANPLLPQWFQRVFSKVLAFRERQTWHLRTDFRNENRGAALSPRQHFTKGNPTWRAPLL